MRAGQLEGHAAGRCQIVVEHMGPFGPERELVVAQRHVIAGLQIHTAGLCALRVHVAGETGRERPDQRHGRDQSARAVGDAGDGQVRSAHAVGGDAGGGEIGRQLGRRDDLVLDGDVIVVERHAPPGDRLDHRAAGEGFRGFGLQRIGGLHVAGLRGASRRHGAGRERAARAVRAQDRVLRRAQAEDRRRLAVLGRRGGAEALGEGAAQREEVRRPPLHAHLRGQ